MKPLAALLAQGQSPWLDYIRRSLLTHGDLARMVNTDGITGVTINPTIFEKAIAGSTDYDAALRVLLAREPHLSAAELYERLAIEDVTLAADILRPVYDRTKGADGFVSLEVAPGLAHNTPGTIAEARRLWASVHRPNLLIKVPATPEGIPAIQQLLSENINVNITLMFSLAHYEAVAQAYLAALARSSAPSQLASVASIFVSRIDTAVDKLLDASTDPRANALKGKIAIANSRVIYARFQELFEGAAFPAWAKQGARPQRLLWASTSTKDPSLRDTLYVEELVGPETVDTIPPATLAAFEDHGVVRGNTVTEGVPEARDLLKRAKEVGIDLVRITEALQVEGVAAFAASYAQLLASLDTRKKAILAGAIDPQVWNLGPAAKSVELRIQSWQDAHVGDRLWRGDPTLWPAAAAPDVADRLGWLRLPETMRDALPALLKFAEEVRADGTRHVVVLGMGGSSLAPNVFRRIFGPREGYPELLVLDSTHPDAIREVQSRIDPRHTLFVVSSKSGTTTEPLSFHRYFWEVLRAAGEAPERRFIAVTDPGTPLEKLAQDLKFRATFRALPTVGGRYSALTMFGLVPAALCGVDVLTLLDRARTMGAACAPSIPVPENPALRLGATLGELATHGRDKLTFYASPSFAPFPDWIEQLVAESTGKTGKGIVPIVDEPMLAPEVYGPDRLFVEIEEGDGVNAALASHTARLEAAGHPVVRLRARELVDLGQEFFRWELAVASSGMILGIDPFDQPDVELAKELARRAMAPAAPGAPTPEVETVAGGDPAALSNAVRAWLATCRPGDYAGIQAYLAPSAETWSALEAIRRRTLERMHVATTLGYGPRFLHSTGQLHKGGPNTGLFLQLVDTPRQDLEVPGAGYTFGQLIRAQSLGDYQALRHKGRRVLRVDLGTDVAGGLGRVREALDG
ncbi:MAG TPA: bifunctional transaldolase/phosoglucose isomerase [Thermoplasmata archaeon]|nr:bifunctional transaldolase/phosoglucose isomerase [Thermoplasmata archaeon]